MRFTPLFLLLLFSNCASLQNKQIDIPKDVASRRKVVTLSKEKQVEEKKLRVKEAVPKKNLRVVKNPFRVGERIRMNLTYIGIKAATIVMEVKPYVKIDGRKAFHFHGTATSSALMNLVYRLDDVIDVFVDYVNFIPLKMTLTLNESKQDVSMVLIYDHERKISSFWKKRIDSKGKVTEIRREDDFVPFAQDIMSSLYYVRTQELKVGDKVKFVVHDNGKNWNMTVDVVKEERIWTRLGSIDTVLLRPTIERKGEVFKKGRLLLWVTNDERKIPVKFKAKVKIGSLYGIIKDYVVPEDM